MLNRNVTPPESSSRAASIYDSSSIRRPFHTMISNTSNPSRTQLQIVQKEWSIFSLSPADDSYLNLGLAMIDILSDKVEKEIHPKTTPFDEKDVMYRLVKKIHQEIQTQSPWWKFFHMYSKCSIKPPDSEKGTMYASCNMCEKNIN